MNQAIRGVSRPRVPTPPPKPIRQPMLRAVLGDLAGSEVRLEQNPVTIGRDPASCQLVFPSTADLISKRHCVLRHDRERGLLLLEDCGSTNGTFLQSGERLKPGSPRRLDHNERFYLADPRFMFEVKEGGR
jgi:pSer/pThr/pTyr-binding forkhead associated (FHA) protein